jgi:hypothetical protein
MALCLDWVFHCWRLCLSHRSHRRRLSYFLPSDRSSILWHLGSFWPVINRVVMAIIWYGVQSYIGGTKPPESLGQHGTWDVVLTHHTVSRRIRYFDD